MSTYNSADDSVTDLAPTAVVGRTAVVGVLAGLAFGAIMQFALGRMTAVGALYTLGEPSLSVGWVAHLAHSALFGAIFGLLADTAAVREHARRLAPAAALGAAFATALWLGNVVVVWPLWLNSVGFATTVPFPNLAVMPLVGHLVWGALLGAGTAVALSR